ncbi:MAG: hypothetical protein IPN42_08705 [Methylococcaceae bacterium]|nr:hypothetical protein [Methylococcaceae bacterium]
MYKDTRFIPGTSWEGLTLWLLTVIVLSQPMALKAEDVATTNKTMPFHIAPQELENVLDQFIAATDWQVGYSPLILKRASKACKKTVNCLKLATGGVMAEQIIHLG